MNGMELRFHQCIKCSTIRQESAALFSPGAAQFLNHVREYLVDCADGKALRKELRFNYSNKEKACVDDRNIKHTLPLRYRKNSHFNIFINFQAFSEIVCFFFGSGHD